MNIQVIGSSSAGNCYVVSEGSSKIMIEAGVSWKRVKEALDFKTHELEFVLSAHRHADHSKYLKDAVGAGINCYMNADTAEARGLSGHRVNIIEPGKRYVIGDWQIRTFAAVHDVPCLGFLIQSPQGERLVYLSDSSYSPFTFRNINYWMVEINFCKETLDANVKNGSVPVEHKNRLLRFHLSLETAVDLFKANDLSHTKQIILLHLSEGNSDEALIKKTIQQITGKPVYIAQANSMRSSA